MGISKKEALQAVSYTHLQEHLLSEISHIQTLITCTGLDEFVNSRFQMDKIFKIVEGTVESEELCVQL